MTSNSSVEAFVRGLRKATAKRKAIVHTGTVCNDETTTREQKAETYRANLLSSILNHMRKVKEQDNE